MVRALSTTSRSFSYCTFCFHKTESPVYTITYYLVWLVVLAKVGVIVTITMGLRTSTNTASSIYIT